MGTEFSDPARSILPHPVTSRPSLPCGRILHGQESRRRKQCNRSKTSRGQEARQMASTSQHVPHVVEQRLDPFLLCNGFSWTRIWTESPSNHHHRYLCLHSWRVSCWASSPWVAVRFLSCFTSRARLFGGGPGMRTPGMRKLIGKAFNDALILINDFVSTIWIVMTMSLATNRYLQHGTRSIMLRILDIDYRRLEDLIFPLMRSTPLHLET